MNPKIIFDAFKEVLGRRNYLLGFFISNIIFLSVFILLPTFLIPANSLAFQLSIFTIKDYLLLLSLSALSSLLIVMQIYVYKKAKAIQSTKVALQGSSAIIAAIFGTASCSSCLAAIFGFLGIGSVLFLIAYKNFIVAGSILIILISLYYASIKVKGVCDGCKKEDVRKNNQNK